jgi:hypothetical protein
MERHKELELKRNKSHASSLEAHIIDDPDARHLFRWLQTLGVRDRVVYHHGSTIFELTALTGDFSPLAQWCIEQKRGATLTVAELALTAAEEGLVHLSVRRQHPNGQDGLVLYSLAPRGHPDLDDEIPF